MEALSIVKQQEQRRVGSARDCVYVVLENGELYPVLYSTYEEAHAAVLEKHREQLDDELAEGEGMGGSDVHVAEDTSGQTKLYVEKEIYIIIQRYKAIMPK